MTSFRRLTDAELIEWIAYSTQELAEVASNVPRLVDKDLVSHVIRGASRHLR